MESYEFVVTGVMAGQRVDKVLTEEFSSLTRSYLQKLFESGEITVNASCVKNGYKLKMGDLIQVCIPDAVKLEVLPEDIPLSIVFEDQDVILVDKPRGMVVHPAAGHTSGTLVNALLFHCNGELSGINGVLRPGIVHRIDKDTTGIVIICKNDLSHKSLAGQLKDHSLTRRYFAIVYGNLKDDEGSIDAPIGRHPIDRKKMAINQIHGRDAVTHYQVLERFSQFTLIECRLQTGRTHQIRVHMASIGHPVLGDPVYGPAKSAYKLDGQMLHAYILGFIHPRTESYMEFQAEPPADFQRMLGVLRKILQ